MKIQFFKRTDTTSFDYLGTCISEICRAHGHKVVVKSINKFVEGEGIERAEVGMSYGLISDIRHLAAYPIKIAGLVCEKDLTPKEIKIIKNIDPTEIWVPSEFVMKKFQEAGFIKNLALVPHGLGEVTKVKNKKRTDKVLMIFNSYKKADFSVERKGIFEVLEAWGKYKIPQKLILRTKYRNYYGKYDLSNVSFIEDRVEDIGGLLNDCDAVLCPSYSEGFGIVGLEALAHGVPLISTKTGNDYLQKDVFYTHIDLPVTVEKIKIAIDETYLDLDINKKIAMGQADRVYKKYKWQSLYKIIEKRISVLKSKRYS